MNKDVQGNDFISNVMVSFSQFFNEYIFVKGKDGIEHHPTYREKAGVKFYEEMMSKGYKLKILRGRGGRYIDWVKEN